MTSYGAQWEAIVNSEVLYSEGYYARISAEENADATPEVVPYSEEWYGMVVRAREEILGR